MWGYFTLKKGRFKEDSGRCGAGKARRNTRSVATGISLQTGQEKKTCPRYAAARKKQQMLSRAHVVTTGRTVNITTRATALGKSLPNKTTEFDCRCRGWPSLPTDEAHGNGPKPPRSERVENDTVKHTKQEAMRHRHHDEPDPRNEGEGQHQTATKETNNSPM